MVRAFAGSKDVGVAGCKREVCAAVLQGEAAAFRDDTGAEAAVVAIDKGHAVALLVCHGEVNGVAVVVCRAAVIEDVAGPVWVEELRAFGEVRAGN